MRFHKILIISIFLPFLMLSQLMGGTTGKISGKITDADSNDPLIGVNVVVEGTSKGAATDIDGNYFIINLPPGKYTVRITSLGYTTKIISNVTVNVDKTTKLNEKLLPSIIQGETVTIIAKKPIIEVDRTFATSTVGGEDLDVMPIARLQEAVDIQAGVVDGHFRGGRSGEVVYMIDGIPVQDVYDNTQGTAVNQSVVQELQVISGTFNAEYGQAMSGIVNMVTKEGGNEYHGSFTAHYGDFLSTHDEEFYNIDEVNFNHIRNYEGSLSGPVPVIPKTSFFLNGRFEDSDGWYYGQRRWNTKFPVIVNNQGNVMEGFLERANGEAVSLNPDRNLYLYGKLSYPLTDNIKLHYSSLWEDRRYKDYDHEWKFVPDGIYYRNRIGRTNMLRVVNALSQSAFLETGYVNSYTEYHHHLYEDPYDDRYANPWYEDILDTEVNLKVAGTKRDHFRRFTDTHSIQSKLAWQVNPIHYVVAGFNVNFNEIYYRDFLVVAQPNEVLHNETPGEFSYLEFDKMVEADSSLNMDSYLYHPLEYSIYLQDKIELQRFIVNIGLRFDYFDPDGKILADPMDPNVANPMQQDRRLDPYSERLGYWYKNPSSKSQISPRIGLAYPISPTGVLHFAYGHFFQRPKYEYLYTNPEFELDPNEKYTLMGNADLEAEKTISYEFGLQQGLTEDLSLGLSLYQRNIRNLVASNEIHNTYQAGSYYMQYSNSDFGEVKGIVLSLDKRYSNNISGGIDYTYQIAEGNASEPKDAFDAQKAEEEPIKQLIPLNWDRRHTINANINYVIADQWGLSLLTTYGSGLPYTSKPKSGDAHVDQFFKNDSRKPAYFNVDLNGFYNLTHLLKAPFNVKLEIMVRNLFDRLNENSVYDDTGRATYTRDQELRVNDEEPYINTLEERYNHPDYYSRPREFRMGLSIVF